MKKWYVFDTQTGEVLFEGDTEKECFEYMVDYYGLRVLSICEV